MSKLRIGGDVSGAKKSILSLGKELKSLGKTKISVFSDKDRSFIKNELNKELSLMKTKLVENKAEISKMVKEQNKLERGTKAELDSRKKIIQEYHKQTRLAKDMDRLQKQKKDMGGFGGVGGSSGTGGVSGFMGKLGGGALAIGGMAVLRGYQAAKQYAAGASDRVRLKGLGVNEDSFGSPEELAKSGLNEQGLIKRRINSVSRLGRAGGSNESILGQAKFERSYGLEEGTMGNVSNSLRGQMGGAKADQTQMKLQASILASGIEDAIAPYLESATELLQDINKNGMSNSDEMIRVFAELTKQGARTPEQIADAFKGIDSAVRGATGESNAFMQTAFSRGGIGGGTIGATKLAMSSGGITGLDEDELSKRGYNPELLKNMKGAGFMSGMGDRTGALLNQYKSSAGMGKGDSIGGVTDLNKMVGLSSMANSTLGTEGLGGFDALKMMEQVQNKQMSQKQFESKLQEMKDNKDPSLDRLNKINATLAGQTTILENINTNLMENLGKTTIKAKNIGTELDNTLVQGTGNVAGAIDSTGALDKGMSAASSTRANLTGGGLGEKLYDMIHGSPADEQARLFKDAQDKFSKQGNLPSSMTDPDAMAKAVESGMTKAMQAQKTSPIQNTNKVNVKVQTGDGRVVNKTHK